MTAATTTSYGDVIVAEEPFFSYKKLKFLCSFGGKIVPRSNDGKLRYVGGDKRIVSMRKEVTFAELMQKMVEVFGENVVLKYQLPGEDLDALITVTCDEDLENMVDEYDKVAKEYGDASMKIRVFLIAVLESELTTGTTGHLDAQKSDVEFRAGGGMKRMDRSVSALSNKHSEGLAADPANEKGGQEGMVSGSLHHCSNAGLVYEGASRLIGSNEDSNSQTNSMDINVGLFPPPIVASVSTEPSISTKIAGYDTGSFADCQPKGFNYVNYVTESAHVQHASSQKTGIGGIPISVNSCSYFPIMPADTVINSVPPSPSSLLDGLTPSVLRLESVENGNFGMPVQVRNDPNPKTFQSVSQRPPLPPPSTQTSNASIYNGMYMWPQAPLPPTWAYQGNAERLDNRLMYTEVLPHAQSDPLGVGTMSDAPETSTTFRSLQNLEDIKSNAPCESSTLVSSNDTTEHSNEGVVIGSKRGTSENAQILKGQSESSDATLHKAEDVSLRKNPLATDISMVLITPSNEVETSQCPHWMTRVTSSNDIVEQKQDGAGSSPQSDTYGHSQVSKGHYYNDVISLQKIGNVYQNEVPLPAVAAAFPADLVSLYGFYPTYLPQSTYLQMSQKYQQYPHLIAGRYLVPQNISTPCSDGSGFSSRNGVFQTSEPSNRDVRTEVLHDLVVPAKEVAIPDLNTKASSINVQLKDKEFLQNERSEYLPLRVENKDKDKYHVSEGESIWSNDKVSPPALSGGSFTNPMQLPSLNSTTLNSAQSMDLKNGQVLLKTEPTIPNVPLLGASSNASRIPDATRKEQNPHLINGYNASPLYPVSNHKEDIENTQMSAPVDLLIHDLGPQGIRQNTDLSSLQLKGVTGPLVLESYIDNNSGNACELLTMVPSEKRDYDKALNSSNNLLSGIVGPLIETQITTKMQEASEDVVIELKQPLMVTLNSHKPPIPQIPALNRETRETPKMVNTGPRLQLGKENLSGTVTLVAHLPKLEHQSNELYLASTIVTEKCADNITLENAFFCDKKVKDVKNKELEKKNPGLQASDDVGRLQIIKNSDLEELRELGSGTFGTVYHGKWRGTDVAIKRINNRCFAGKPSEEERLRADFWNEACNLADLHHPNVVAFYGVVLDGAGDSVATVTEYMVNGSLLNALQRNDKTFDKRKRLLIAMDVAFGMEYLHGKNIVHFDLKCDNLLVNLRDPQRPICKVGDLGLSKVKCQTLISGGVRGTLPWMAPELLNGLSSLVSEKVDVFSFGIVMWEILTGEEPYADLHYGTIIGGIVNNTLRPPVPDSCDPEWRSLMEKCWSANPSDRPNFTEIASTLRSMAVSSCAISTLNNKP